MHHTGLKCLPIRLTTSNWKFELAVAGSCSCHWN